MGIFDRTQYSFWKSNQSYTLFWVLSVLGGVLALDHLYLRSPLTFLAKIIVNILGIGLWWIYDATQASFNKDVVKIYGLGIPGMGPKGIGAGSLSAEKHDPKHANFLIYSLALIFGGLFGIDSFITGNSKLGFIRLISLISVILAPFVILYWLFNLGKFFFKTESIIEQYWEYFGAPQPEHLKKSFLDKLEERFPFLQGIIHFIKSITGNISSITNKVTKLAENPVGTIESDITAPIKNMIGSVESDITAPIKNLLGPIESAVQTTIGPIIQPLTSTITGAEQIATKALSTTDDALQIGKEGIETIKTLGEGAIDTLKSVGELSSLAGVASSTMNSVTPGALKEAAKLGALEGGGQIQSPSYLAYIFVGTIALIAVSGLVKTYQRLRQNKDASSAKKQRGDDTPPEPRAI
jgi:hypothetical protein